MSRRSSTSGKGGAKKAKGAAGDPDVYVAMLYVSVTSLIVGITLLSIECSRYNWLLGK